jgi:hypothetical protein
MSSEKSSTAPGPLQDKAGRGLARGRVLVPEIILDQGGVASARPASRR